MATQNEIAELVDLLRHNVDEANQFNLYISDLINGCKKSVLLNVLDSLIDSVEDNIENSYNHQYLQEDINILKEKLTKAKEILDRE